MNRRLPAWLAIAVFAGCGIPHDAEPTVIPGGVVNPPLAAADAPPNPAFENQLFLVQAEQVVRVVRRTTQPRDLGGVLALLLKGPTESEFASGNRTAISPQTTLRSATLDGDTAIVDLSGALVEVGGQEQILGVAQIVLTATAVPGVSQVRLLLEGQAVEVPRADGTLTSETLRAGDYSGLVR